VKILCLMHKVSNDTIVISTNYFRELIYNLKHTVHHMALIGVGINEVSAVKVYSRPCYYM